MGGGVSTSYVDGILQVTRRIGIGIGGGISLDPDGAPSPHSKVCGSGYIARTSLNAAAGIGRGPVGIDGPFAMATGNAITTPVGGGFISVTDSGSIGGSRGVGLRLGASMGVDVGSHSNWK